MWILTDSDIKAGTVNNGKDAAIIVSDLSSLTNVLTATVPLAFGGNIAGAGSSVVFGADGGHVQYIDVVLGKRCRYTCSIYL